MFSQRGIDTHVVCGTKQKDNTTIETETLTIHRIQSDKRSEFIEKSPHKLLYIHNQSPLQLIEAPEYGAEPLYIKQLLPQVPLIVKFHTPAYLIKKLNDHYFDRQLHRKIKYLFKKYNPQSDPEYSAAITADYFLSPSISLIEIISRDWKIDKDKISHAPNPYIPHPSLLQMPVEKGCKTILYMGRLETRKGVLNMAKAIPLVLKKIPDAQFIFLGKNDRGPWRKKTMKEILTQETKGFRDNIHFADQVSLFEMPGYLAKAGICIFPSLWENFPNVCLEAMSAGRAVIASKNGGMAEMLQPVKNKILVDPNNVIEIADAIVYLLANADEFMLYGSQCRERIATYYSTKLVDELLSLYQDMITKRQMS